MTPTMVFPTPRPPTAGRLPRWPVFGERPFRTDGDVLALAFDATSLWSVDESGALRRWDLATGREAADFLVGDQSTVWAFDGTARLLATAGVDLGLWEAATGRQLVRVPQPAWVTAVAFAPGGDVVATGHDDGGVRLWDAADGQLLGQLRGHPRPVSALAFSPDGRRLATAGEDKVILLWDVPAGELTGVLAGHTDRVPALAWSPDGSRLYSAGWDTTARVWDTASGEPVILLNSHASQVATLAVSPDGRLLACADSDNAVHVWDLTTRRTLHVLRGHEGEVRCLAWARDGQALASGGADQVIHLWDALAGRPLSGPSGPVGHGARVAVSPDGGRLAVAGGDGVAVWDTATGRQALEVSCPGVLHAVAVSPDGLALATGGESPAARLWDARTGRLRRILNGPQPPVAALAFSPDSACLATAGPSSGDVWLWDAATGEAALLIPEAVPGCTAHALAFHPQGRLLAVAGIDWLATGGSDGGIALWDVAGRRRETVLRGGAVSAAFHPSGHRLAVASLDRLVRVWDVAAGRVIAELAGHDDSVTSLAYRPDGCLLASGADDCTVRFWDASTGALRGVADLHTKVKSVAFAPDGRFLYTGNGNGSSCQLEVERIVHG